MSINCHHRKKKEKKKRKTIGSVCVYVPKKREKKRVSGF